MQSPWRQSTLLFAMIAALLPGAIATSADQNRAAWAKDSSIPGLYAVGAIDGSASQHGIDIDDQTGLLWVIEGFTKVTAYDHARLPRRTIDAIGSGIGMIDGPSDLAIADGEVFLAELGNDRVQVFDTSGNHLRMWGSLGTGSGEFADPCGLEVVGSTLYVADSGNQRVSAFNKDTGAYINSFGGPGTGDGELDLGCVGPSMTHVGGELFVVERGNARVSVFDLDGNWQRHIGVGTLADPSGIDPDNAGRIWVADCTHNNVTLWTAAGELADSFGSSGTELGSLSCPVGVAVDPQGDTVWVTEWGNQRVQTFTTLLCAGQTLTHVGTSYPDTFELTENEDVVRLGRGNDTVMLGDGDDVACGGMGQDTIRGGLGADLIIGEKGNDRLHGGGGKDTLRGVAGDDKMWGGSGADLLQGGAGADEGYGQNGNDTVNGSKGNDTLYGDLGADSLNGGKGKDLGFGGDGNDVVSGNDGNDELNGNAGDDGLWGGAGTDVCKGHNGFDTAVDCETTFGVP